MYMYMYMCVISSFCVTFRRACFPNRAWKTIQRSCLSSCTCIQWTADRSEHAHVRSKPSHLIFEYIVWLTTLYPVQSTCAYWSRVVVYCISLGDLAFHSACGVPSELQTTVTVAHTVWAQCTCTLCIRVHDDSNKLPTSQKQYYFLWVIAASCTRACTGTCTMCTIVDCLRVHGCVNVRCVTTVFKKRKTLYIAYHSNDVYMSFVLSLCMYMYMLHCLMSQVLAGTDGHV